MCVGWKVSGFKWDYIVHSHRPLQRLWVSIYSQGYKALCHNSTGGFQSWRKHSLAENEIEKKERKKERDSERGEGGGG